MTLHILFSLAALLLAFWLTWKFFKPQHLQDLCVGQIWESDNKQVRWEIVNIDPFVVTIKCEYSDGKGYPLKKTRSEFRKLIKDRGAKLYCH